MSCNYERQLEKAHTPRLASAGELPAPRQEETIERVYRPRISTTDRPRTPPTGGSSVKPPRDPERK